MLGEKLLVPELPNCMFYYWLVRLIFGDFELTLVIGLLEVNLSCVKKLFEPRLFSTKAVYVLFRSRLREFYMTCFPLLCCWRLFFSFSATDFFVDETLVGLARDCRDEFAELI